MTFYLIDFVVFCPVFQTLGNMKYMIVYLSIVSLQAPIFILIQGVLTKLLEVCGQFMLGKNKTAKSHWHPVLGWAAQPFNYKLVC